MTLDITEYSYHAEDRAWIESKDYVKVVHTLTHLILPGHPTLPFEGFRGKHTSTASTGSVGSDRLILTHAGRSMASTGVRALRDRNLNTK